MIDKYSTDSLSIVNAPAAFRPHIGPVFPPDNNLIFEEWFRQNYVGCDTDRVYLDCFFTSWWVNNDYGKNEVAKQEMQQYIDGLDKFKKYFIICQYDDGVLINWNGLDVLEFNMSKNVGVQLPLLCQPHPFKFIGPKKWFASFVGSKTHPIREGVNALKGKDGYCISFEPNGIERYCRILHESMFTLCYRGYGASSFRIAESIQYGSIPVYISNEFIIPYGINFEEFGVLIEEKDADRIDEILQAIEPIEVIRKQEKLQEIYEKYYTYESNLTHIINHLEAECDNRQSERKTA